MIYVLLKNRWFIIKVIAVVMVLTIGGSYLLSNKYTVTTVILPPEEQASPALNIGGLSLGEFAGFFSGGMGYSLPLMTTLADVYSDILNSRTLIDHVITSTSYIDSAGFDRRYERQPEVAMFLARKHFRKNYSATVTSSGFIKINVTTGDPMYSVEVSERVIILLDSINTSITLARYRTSRESTENQLAVAHTELENTTQAMLSFEEEYGTIMPGEELSQVMSVLTEMKGRYIETTMMANAVRSGFRSGTTAQILELDATAEALRQSIEMVENGSVSGNVDLGVGLSNLPPAMIEYARLHTDFEMQLKMVTALELQVQQALVQEENITSSLRILDPPRHPGWKSKPKRLYIWIEVFIIMSIILVVFFYSRERWYTLRQENPEVWNKWHNIGKDIRNDFRIKRKR
jgi:capsule polysaccharide export protein KpsE/RkpR